MVRKGLRIGDARSSDARTFQTATAPMKGTAPWYRLYDRFQRLDGELGFTPPEDEPEPDTATASNEEIAAHRARKHDAEMITRSLEEPLYSILALVPEVPKGSGRVAPLRVDDSTGRVQLTTRWKCTPVP